MVIAENSTHIFDDEHTLRQEIRQLTHNERRDIKHTHIRTSPLLLLLLLSAYTYT